MTHASLWWRMPADNQSDNWYLWFYSREKLGCSLFLSAADLANENDSGRILVSKKHFHALDETNAVDGISSHTNGS
jgi:hypothetical protein